MRYSGKPREFGGGRHAQRQVISEMVSNYHGSCFHDSDSLAVFLPQTKEGADNRLWRTMASLSAQQDCN